MLKDDRVEIKESDFLNTLKIASLQMGSCFYKRLIPV